MKKTISILSIIAIVLSALALLWATALLFGFWEQVCVVLYDMPEEVIAAGPILPIGNVVYMVSCIALVVVAYICSKSSKTIAGEVISIIILSIVIPIVTSLLTVSQNAEIASDFRKYSAVTALSIANTICSFATRLTVVANALCYVVCGMSIAEKIHAKRLTIAKSE